MKELGAKSEATRWYAVADKDGNPDKAIWTLSTDPNELGWETDSGFPGYGLFKAEAEFLAQAANEKLERMESQIGEKPEPAYRLADGHAYISRGPRPGFVLCDDPLCCKGFGHPHYHEAPKQSENQRGRS